MVPLAPPSRERSVVLAAWDPSLLNTVMTLSALVSSMVIVWFMASMKVRDPVTSFIMLG